MKDENLVEVPKDLALAILDWHGGQGSSIYMAGSSGYAGRAVDAEIISEAIDELETSGAPESLVEAMRELLYAWEEQRDPDPDIIAYAVEGPDDDDDDYEDDEDYDSDDDEPPDDEDEDDGLLAKNPGGYPQADGEPIDPAEIKPDLAGMAADRRNKLRR